MGCGMKIIGEQRQAGAWGFNNQAGHGLHDGPVAAASAALVPDGRTTSQGSIDSIIVGLRIDRVLACVSIFASRRSAHRICTSVHLVSAPVVCSSGTDRGWPTTQSPVFQYSTSRRPYILSLILADVV